MAAGVSGGVGDGRARDEGGKSEAHLEEEEEEGVGPHSEHPPDAVDSPYFFPTRICAFHRAAPPLHIPLIPTPTASPLIYPGMRVAGEGGRGRAVPGTSKADTRHLFFFTQRAARARTGGAHAHTRARPPGRRSRQPAAEPPHTAPRVDKEAWPLADWELMGLLCVERQGKNKEREAKKTLPAMCAGAAHWRAPPPPPRWWPHAGPPPACRAPAC